MNRLQHQLVIFINELSILSILTTMNCCCLNSRFYSSSDDRSKAGLNFATKQNNRVKPYISFAVASIIR